MRRWARGSLVTVYVFEIGARRSTLYSEVRARSLESEDATWPFTETMRENYTRSPRAVRTSAA
jgi:hypothetical protein